MAEMLEKQRHASLHIFFSEVEHVELEHELVFSAIFFLDEFMLGGKVFEARS